MAALTLPQSAAASSRAADRAPRSESSPERGDFSVTFRDLGDFAALNAARTWLMARGFSSGRTEHGSPIGVMLGEYNIQKWRNLSPEDRADLHGMIKSPTLSFREGPLTVVINRYAPASVIAAFNSEPEDLCAQMHVEGTDWGRSEEQGS